MAMMICTSCHATGEPRSLTRGSIVIELVLWLLCLVPGLIYSVWRLSTRAKVCKTCSSPQLVPLNSPMGRQLTGQSGSYGHIGLHGGPGGPNSG